MSETNLEEEPFGVETNILRKSVIVKNRIDNEEFEFKIPSLMDEIAIGTHMKRMRHMVDPMDDGGPLDPETMAWLRAATYFERQLLSASVDWPYTKNTDGSRTVRASEIPIEKVSTVLIVGGIYHNQVAQFRNGRPADAGNVGN